MAVLAKTKPVKPVLPGSSIDRLLKAIASEDWDKALAIAVKLKRLGSQKEVISTAYSASRSPDFYLQIKKNPEQLVAAGVDVLKLFAQIGEDAFK